MITQPEFGNGDDAGAEGGGLIPGLHADLFGMAGGERFFVEHGGGGGVYQEALVGAVYLEDYDGEAIAALQRNFAGVDRRLRLRGGAMRLHREREDCCRENSQEHNRPNLHHSLDGEDDVTWSMRRRMAALAERKAD